MKKVTITTYRKVAVTLWAVVSVVAGFTVGEMFDLSGRKTVFAVAVAVGVYVLFIVRLYRSTDVQMEKSIDEHVNGFDRYEVEKSSSNDRNNSWPAKLDIKETGVEEMQNNNEEMTNKETQEWLDKFLVNQQKGEKK